MSTFIPQNSLPEPYPSYPLQVLEVSNSVSLWQDSILDRLLMSKRILSFPNYKLYVISKEQWTNEIKNIFSRNRLDLQQIDYLLFLCLRPIPYRVRVCRAKVTKISPEEKFRQTKISPNEKFRQTQNFTHQDFLHKS